MKIDNAVTFFRSTSLTAVDESTPQSPPPFSVHRCIHFNMWSPTCSRHYCGCYKCNLHYELCFKRVMDPPRVSSRLAAIFWRKPVDNDDDDYPGFYLGNPATPSHSHHTESSGSSRSPSPQPEAASLPAEQQQQHQQREQQSTSPPPETSVPAISQPPPRAATAPIGTPEIECFYCCPDGGADHQINKCWKFVTDVTTQQQIRVLTSQSRCFCCWKKSAPLCRTPPRRAKSTTAGVLIAAQRSTSPFSVGVATPDLCHHPGR